MRKCFQVEFIIKNGVVRVSTRKPERYIIGYRVYDLYGSQVGYVYMTDDRRSPFYGYTELYFLPDYENRYGIWHRFKSHGQKLSWLRLTEMLSQCGEYKVYVD